MERQKKIVDSSVMVKLFAEEENTERMFEIMKFHINNEIILIAPELIFLETLNALRYKKLEQSFLEQVSKDLWNFQLEVIYLDEFLIGKAINLSHVYDLSIYDAIYAALSQIYGTQLITADEKLLKIPNAVSLNNF